MDDVYTAPPARGDSIGVETVSPVVAEKWSCIDYVDTPRSDGMEATQPRLAEKPGSDGLSVRFDAVSESVSPRGDKPGRCEKKTNTGVSRAGCGSSITFSIDAPGITGGGTTEQRWIDKRTNHGWPGTAEEKINTAQGMAGDLVSNLDSEEKSAVAGILTRTVSGGEVVEVTAVTTTSVMANVCYDLEHPVAVPFGCVGFGTNIISVADGHVDAKLAYRIQGGLSYNVTPRVTAFVSGYYHKVLGEGEYDDIPVERLRDDQSPEGRSKNYALARFKMAYVGAEMGVRFAF